LLNLTKLEAWPCRCYGKSDEQLTAIFYVGFLEVKIAVTSNSAGKHHVLFHDFLALGVDETNIWDLKQTNYVSLCGLLNCHDCA
jgi:hypothetical protein